MSRHAPAHRCGESHASGQPKVFCDKCGVRLVDGARAKYCGFTICLDLASESILAEKRIPKS